MVEEEEPCELEPADQLQLAVEACARLGLQQTVASAVPLAKRLVADRAQLLDRRVSTVREVGIAVAELLGEVERQPLGENAGALRRRSVDPVEALDHLGRRAEHGLPISSPLALAPVERRAVANRDERVLEQCPPPRVRVDVPRRDRLHPEVLGKVAERRMTTRVASLVRSLELDEEPLAAERRGEPGCATRVVVREPVPRAAGETDEPFVQLGDGLERRGRREEHAVLFPGRTGARMCSGEDPTEVRVALTALAEQRDVTATFEGHFRPGDRPDTGERSGVRELERAVDAVVIGERKRRVSELDGSRNQLLGMRRTVEERVRRMAVQLDVAGRH